MTNFNSVKLFNFCDILYADVITLQQVDTPEADSFPPEISSISVCVWEYVQCDLIHKPVPGTLKKILNLTHDTQNTSLKVKCHSARTTYFKIARCIKI